MDGDQLHVRHGDEVAEVGSVIERVPVTYLDRGDANGHGVLVVDARPLTRGDSVLAVTFLSNSQKLSISSINERKAPPTRGTLILL